MIKEGISTSRVKKIVGKLSPRRGTGIHPNLSWLSPSSKLGLTP